MRTTKFDCYTRPLKRHGLAILGLMLANVAFYLQAIGSSDASIQWDTVDNHYTALKYLSDSLHDGRMPLWTDRVFSGYPFIAAPEVAAFYPVNLALALLTRLTPWVIQFQILVHGILASVGMYLLAYRLCASRWAAVVGALSYAFSGFFVGHASHLGMQNTAAWIPWLVYCYISSLQASCWIGWAVAGSWIWAAIILAGHFQCALYAGMVLAAFAVAHVVFESRGRAPGKARGSLVACLAFIVILSLGSLLSAIQVLPSWELLVNSQRPALDFTGSRNGSLQLAASWSLLVPNAFGAVTGNPYLLSADRSHSYLYVGILPLLLACFYLVKGRDRYFPVWLGLSLFGLFYMFSELPLLHQAIYGFVPFFGKLRSPANYMLVMYFAISLMAAQGYARIQATEWSARRGWGSFLFLALAAAPAIFLPREVQPMLQSTAGTDDALRMLGAANLAVSQWWSGFYLILAAVLLPLAARQSAWASWLSRRRKPADGYKWVLLAIGCFALLMGLTMVTGINDSVSLILAGKFSFLNRAKESGWLLAAFAVGCVLASLCLGYLAYRCSRSSSQAVCAGLLICLAAFADLHINGSLANHMLFARRSFDRFYRLPEKKPILEAMRSKLAPEERVEYSNFGYGLGPLNQSYLFGFNATHGYHPLGLGWYADLGAPYSSAGTFQNMVHNREELRDLMRIRFVVEDQPDPDGSRPVQVTERKGDPPRGVFARSLRLLRNPEKCADVLAQINPLRDAVLDSADAPASYPAEVSGSAELLVYQPERLRLRAQSATGGLLVLGEVYYPGWEATIEGHPVEVIRVDCALRGVFMPPGSHEIELRYRPGLLYLGAALSLAGIAVCGLFLWAAFRRRRTGSWMGSSGRFPDSLASGTRSR